MKKNKYLIILTIIMVLFSFKTEVNAAKKLTCTYENGYRLTQDTDGNFALYYEDPNVDGKWNELKTVLGKSEKKEKVEFIFESKNYDDSTKTLDACPKYTRNDYQKYYYYDKTELFHFDYELISDENPEESKNKAQELTCLYQKKGSKNTRDVKKILLTQDSAGVITIYKNEKDVSISDYSEYWQAEAGRKYVFDDPSLKKDSQGKLLECPKSKTTLEYPNYGGVEFFGDTSGEDMLEEGYNELVDFLTYENESDVYDNSGLGQTCDEIALEDKWLTELDESKYLGSCLYQHNTDYGCHIIQLDMSKTKIDIKDSFSGQEISYKGSTGTYVSSIEESGFTPENIQHNYETVGCPSGINVNITHTYPSQGVPGYFYGTVRYSGSGDLYPLVDNGVRGKNMFTGEDLSTETEVNLNFEKIKILDCDQMFNNNEELLGMIKTAINLVKIIIPIALVGFGVVDFGQAVFASKEDDMKKAQQRFIKRLIIALVIFLIPSILKLVLSIAHSIWPVVDDSLCGIL